MKENITMDNEVEQKVSPAYLAKLTSELLKTDDYAARHNARIKLVAIGRRALPSLHRLLSVKNGEQRMETAKVVELIADSRSIPFLIVLLDDPEFEIRWIASEGLVKTGRKCVAPLLRSIRSGKSSLFIAKSAHHVLDALLLEIEKVRLSSLMQVLENHHETSGTAPVEAAKALKILKVKN
jgi:HEAT repeat protein